MSSRFLEVADRILVARYPQWDVNVGLVLGRDGAVVIDTRASDRQGTEVLDDIRRLGRDIDLRALRLASLPSDNGHRSGAGRR